MAKPNLFLEMKKSTNPVAEFQTAVMELFEKTMNDKSLALTAEQQGRLVRMRAQIEIQLANL